MKRLLVVYAGAILASPLQGKETLPVDTMKISKDISLDEVVVTATKAAETTPVAYSNLSKDGLSRKLVGIRI